MGPVTVREVKAVVVPYRTSRVPENEQVPPSVAQAVHVPAGGVELVLEYWQLFTVPGIGSPNTAFVQAIEPVADKLAKLAPAP